MRLSLNKQIFGGVTVGIAGGIFLNISGTESTAAQQLIFIGGIVGQIFIDLRHSALKIRDKFQLVVLFGFGSFHLFDRNFFRLDDLLYNVWRKTRGHSCNSDTRHAISISF